MVEPMFDILDCLCLDYLIVLNKIIGVDDFDSHTKKKCGMTTHG